MFVRSATPVFVSDDLNPPLRFRWNERFQKWNEPAHASPNRARIVFDCRITNDPAMIPAHYAADLRT